MMISPRRKRNLSKRYLKSLSSHKRRYTRNKLLTSLKFQKEAQHQDGRSKPHSMSPRYHHHLLLPLQIQSWNPFDLFWRRAKVFWKSFKHTRRLCWKKCQNELRNYTRKSSSSLSRRSLFVSMRKMLAWLAIRTTSKIHSSVRLWSVCIKIVFAEVGSKHKSPANWKLEIFRWIIHRPRIWHTCSPSPEVEKWLCAAHQKTDFCDIQINRIQKFWLGEHLLYEIVLSF